MSLLKEIVFNFFGDDCPRLAAALSYYTVFSLPPLMVLVMAAAGALFDPERVQTALLAQAGDLIGPEGGRQLRGVLENLSRPGDGVLTTVLGGVALLFGATAAFANLQASLNRVWQIAPDPDESIVRGFLLKRVLSFGMILGIGFLLLVSLVLTTLLRAFGDVLAEWLPAGISGALLVLANDLLSFGVIALLFAAMFKVLPDAVLEWRDVAVGALVTALLFTVGKAAIGLYLGRADPGSAYGAAGSLAVLLLWVYVSANILLFGAEFTQSWVRRRGRQIRPEPGAVRVREEKFAVD